MSTETAPRKKALGVRATEEQRRLIAQAAKREHRSVSSFVLDAAMREAARITPRPRRSKEEIEAVVLRAQAAMRLANPTGRSLVDELIAERRAEAARE